MKFLAAELVVWLALSACNFLKEEDGDNSFRMDISGPASFDSSTKEIVHVYGGKLTFGDHYDGHHFGLYSRDGLYGKRLSSGEERVLSENTKGIVIGQNFEIHAINLYLGSTSVAEEIQNDFRRKGDGIDIKGEYVFLYGRSFVGDLALHLSYSKKFLDDGAINVPGIAPRYGSFQAGPSYALSGYGLLGFIGIFVIVNLGQI